MDSLIMFYFPFVYEKIKIVCIFDYYIKEKRDNNWLNLSEKRVTLFVNYSCGGDFNEAKCDF